MAAERELEIKLIKAVESRGGVVYKFVSPGKAGMPDRIVILPEGKVGMIEVKAPGQRLRALQKYRKEQLSNVGFQHVYVLDDEKKIEGILDDLQST